MISISINNKSKPFRVHRLLAMTFIQNIKCYEYINHIDGNKLNNELINLEWVSYSENTQHAIKTGLHKIGEDCYNYKHGKYSRHTKGEQNV